LKFSNVLIFLDFEKDSIHSLLLSYKIPDFSSKDIILKYLDIIFSHFILSKITFPVLISLTVLTDINRFLEIQSLNSYSRRESESITKVKELFFKLEKYKEFDYILSITDSPNQATRVYNKPVGLNINLRDIKGEYFLEGYK